MAEFERGLISERTKAGLMAAKRCGKQLGRPPKLTVFQLKHARELVASGQETRCGVGSLFNVDSKTLRRAMSREGIQ